MESPTNINNLREEGALEIIWNNRTSTKLPFRFLREQCSCAHCVHELTGERLLDPATIPEDLHIDSMKLVGNYALKISWSDGHDTGLFTWEVLHRLTHPDLEA